MKVIWFLFATVVTIKVNAQADSIYKDNKWWVCYQERSMPVRTFYPALDTSTIIRSITSVNKARDTVFFRKKRLAIPVRNYGIEVFKISQYVFGFRSSIKCFFRLIRRKTGSTIHSGVVKDAIFKDTKGYPIGECLDLLFYDLSKRKLIKTMTIEIYQL